MTEFGPVDDLIMGLIGRVELADGRSPLSDQILADLTEGRGRTVVRTTDDGAIVGFAHVSPVGDDWTMQVVVDPAARASDRAVAGDLVTQAVAAVALDGGGRLDWWVFQATDHDTALAVGLGFEVGRELHQMRRDLPASTTASVMTRPFTPQDDQAWVDANNRAFAGHPEQGRWTVDTLRQRMAMSWFDPEGFRIHEIDGRIAAFCWTKIHDDEVPAAGEIYVIGVDPDFQGRGLGRQLTLAGLDSITGSGVTRALLYVDGGNDAAVGLYHSLGFTVARTDRAFVRTIAAT